MGFCSHSDIQFGYDFSSLFRHNPDGMCLISRSGVIVDANEKAVQTLREARTRLIGRSITDFVQGRDLERALAVLCRGTQGATAREEVIATRVDGSDMCLEIAAVPQKLASPSESVYAILQDVTERRLAQRSLEMQGNRIRDLHLLATGSESDEGFVISTLQTGCRLLGVENAAIVEASGTGAVYMRHDSLEHDVTDDELIAIAKIVAGSTNRVALRNGDGRSYLSWIGSRLRKNGMNAPVLLFFSQTARARDFEQLDQDTTAIIAAITCPALEQHRTRFRLRQLAYYDSLTGLPNRALFQEQLRDALVDIGAEDTQLAVFFFDLDHFKDINDTLGHAMGDRFLQMVSHRLTSLAGKEGVVARMGGDEFIVLSCECKTCEDVAAFAENLLRTMTEAYTVESHEHFLTASIGVALAPQHGRNEETLVKNADIARHQAKDRGGNLYVVFDESLQLPLRTRITLERQLRRALQREEFVLHFQPIVDVANENIAGVEALVRWQDPQRGLVFPGEFIPAAEATGLIAPLGDWIVRHAVQQARCWQEMKPLYLSINFSARQFYQPALSERLFMTLAANDFSPANFVVEITETMAFSDVIRSAETVRKLKEFGARIAIDDFGTGHSSLNYLRSFEVDTIKIDRSFVAGIGTERSDETIVKAIIAMSHSLGLIVVAEGVETREQFDFLKEHGCDRVQGYLFSRPLEAAALERLIAGPADLLSP